jgi:uncharacterized DUF497 family protein
MDRSLFDWNDANIGHIAEHDVTPEEAEQVILGDSLELDFERTESGEDRWSYIGETSLGRVLQVVFTMRGGKIRVVTAFKPTLRDELTYLRYKRYKTELQ